MKIEQQIKNLTKKLTRHVQIMYENWEEYFGETLDEMFVEEQEMREELARLRAELSEQGS